MPPAASDLEIRSLEQPSISGNKLFFSWNDIIVRATITPYHFPPVKADELSYDFSGNPIVQREVINPILHEVKLDLCNIASFLERFRQLPKNVLSTTAFSYSRTPVIENPFAHLYRVNDSTSWGKNNSSGLLKCVLDYKGVPKRIVPGKEDFVDMAQHIEMVNGTNFACIIGQSLKEAFERALKIYEMSERIRG